MLRIHGLGVLLAVILIAGVLSAAPSAEVLLRLDPADQGIPLGGAASLSLVLDEPLELRSIELWFEYDPAVIASVDAGPGSLFTNTGCLLFNDFDDDTPGEWYGTSIIIGFDCWLTGPGELYRWSFEGLAEGWSRVMAVNIRLYDPEAFLIDEVNLPFTHVFVGGGTDAPEPAPSARLELHPNPFNPNLTLSVGGWGAAARLEAFDLSGRLVARIWDGDLDGSVHRLVWRAEDDAGRPLPSGVYLIRLDSAKGPTQTRRAVLLK